MLVFFLRYENDSDQRCVWSCNGSQRATIQLAFWYIKLTLASLRHTSVTPWRQSIRVGMCHVECVPPAPPPTVIQGRGPSSRTYRAVYVAGPSLRVDDIKRLYRECKTSSIILCSLCWRFTVFWWLLCCQVQAGCRPDSAPSHRLVMTRMSELQFVPKIAIFLYIACIQE